MASNSAAASAGRSQRARFAWPGVIMVSSNVSWRVTRARDAMLVGGSGDGNFRSSPPGQPPAFDVSGLLAIGQQGLRPGQDVGLQDGIELFLGEKLLFEHE